jgi:DNA-binding NarL/FixJ family response regulator
MDAAFAEALGESPQDTGPFERARAELLYGWRLLEDGRMGEAIPTLARALATFEVLGAEPWAERARAAILRGGGALPERQVSFAGRLSARELEVVLAALDGCAPHEIAERLFLGRRTVDLQLASAAIKLGLDSPSQLVEHLRRETRPTRTEVVSRPRSEVG